MSKVRKSKLKSFVSEKEVNAFFKTGEVDEVIGLFMKKNESFILFYTEPEQEKEETEEFKTIKKGKKL